MKKNTKITTPVAKNPKPMTEVVKFLQEKYRGTGYDVVQYWCNDTGVELTPMAVGSLLTSGKDTGIKSLLLIAQALGCTAEELKWICTEKNEHGMARIVAPEIINIDEARLLADYRALDAKNKTMIRNMAARLVTP